MTWMVTGGAGYIGSHVVQALSAADIDCVVLDDLSTGFREFVPDDIPFIEANLLDTRTVLESLRDHAITGVIHAAGYKYAGVSVERPLHTYTQNVTGMIHLLDAMHEADVRRIVFSSSAAVYGTTDLDLVTEDTPTHPESPYGETKLVGEWLLRDVAGARSLSHTSLRYFNVVGSGAPHLYDASPHNLFPIVFDMLYRGETPRINGDDYPTPDGTCVRDYIHATDLARAHANAAQAMTAGRELAPVYNLGSGTGVSVREIMTAIRDVTGIDFEPIVQERRSGDPARIVANGDLAARDIEWAQGHDLHDMVRSAWEARQAVGDQYPRQG